MRQKINREEGRKGGAFFSDVMEVPPSSPSLVRVFL
jgi:hypothetical protein